MNLLAFFIFAYACSSVSYAHCMFHKPSEIFPSDVFITHTHVEIDTLRVNISLNVSKLIQEHYYFYVIAKTKNRDSDIFELGLIHDNISTLVLGSVYRTKEELLYGTNTDELGSVIFTDLQNNPDGLDMERIAEAVALEKVQYILGAQSKCLTPYPDASEIYIRALYESQVTMKYIFRHGVDETDFIASKTFYGTIFNYSVASNEPELTWYDSLHISGVSANQRVLRDDYMISSSLQPMSNSSFNATIRADRKLNNETFLELPSHHILIRLWMSQYIRVGMHMEPLMVPQHPSTFDPHHSPTFAGNQSQVNDIRHDICYVTACTSSMCQENEILHPQGNEFALQTYNVSSPDASVASCFYQSFQGDSNWIPINNQSYSPYTYVRAWFEWSHHYETRRRLVQPLVTFPEYSEHIYKIPLT